MIIASLHDVTFAYGARTVLDGLCWQIQAGQKVGVVGPNGAGKSTLLRLIGGELSPERGTIVRDRSVRIGYLAQQPRLHAQRSVWQEVLSAATALARVQAELRRLEQRMADPQVCDDAAALERTMAAYDRAQAELEHMDGYAHEAHVREVLHALGFDDASLDQPVGTLSGGQKKLVGLARLLSARADVLLLDEPDNHLDLAHKEQLEAFIAGFEGTVLIVSHDRYLLDQTVGDIAEIEDGRLTFYPGHTYSAYAVEKQVRLLRQQQRYAAQQKEIARIEAAIARFELWASLVVNERHARQARSRRKMLERMDRVERPVLERRRMGLQLEGWRGSTKVLEINALDKAFPQPEAGPEGDGENVVLAGVNLLLYHGERVGLLGPNGSGKSVLLRCILGIEEPTGGHITVGPSVRIGYYAQEHETLDPTLTLIEQVRRTRPMYDQEAVSFLGRFLFPYEMTRQPVGTLSGGERSRLQLAMLMLSGCNFLLLDEPTNNLDLPSAEALEGALDEFEGTVLVVSHDRYFLDRVVERIVDLEEGALVEYPGDYSYYREHHRRGHGGVATGT